MASNTDAKKERQRKQYIRGRIPIVKEELKGLKGEKRQLAKELSTAKGSREKKQLKLQASLLKARLKAAKGEKKELLGEKSKLRAAKAKATPLF
jgi:hypothetical protein